MDGKKKREFPRLGGSSVGEIVVFRPESADYEQLSHLFFFSFTAVCGELADFFACKEEKYSLIISMQFLTNCGLQLARKLIEGLHKR